MSGLRLLLATAVLLICLPIVQNASMTPEIDCPATISNYYITSRARVFNKTTQTLLAAFTGSPLGNVADIYQHLLMDLGLDDTPDKDQAFGKAFSQIIAAKTRACTEYQGQYVTAMNITQVTTELRNALDSGSNLNSVRDIFGRALCVLSLVETGSVSRLVAGLSGETRGKIFGLVQRPYSLGFVVDDTGSMSAEIKRVQQIIREFVNGNVGAPTHYILTTFNDPTVGVAVRYDAQNATSKQQLLAAVNALNAHDGGDCPELGMTGIIKALDLSFPEGHLIVLTDAATKDSHRTDEVTRAAHMLGVRVHFAYSHTSGCGTGYPFYDRVARETGGFSIYSLVDLDTLSNAIQNARVTFIEADVPTASRLSSSGDCKAISVPLFAENLYIAINPRARNVEASLQMPNGSFVFGKMKVSSLLIQNFSSPASGEWLICIYSGSVDIKQSQDIRFDITVEFLFQDEATGLHVSTSTPPFTHSKVIAILFSTRHANLSTSKLHTLTISEVDGSKRMDVPLLHCDRFLEGRFTLPSVKYEISFIGFDSNNNSFGVELGTFSEGPQPVSCDPSCENGGTCSDGNTCLCPPGYLGNRCHEQAICRPPCGKFGTCTNHNECTCTYGYTGPMCNMTAFMDCIEPADIAYCQNGGTCRINLLTKSLSCVCSSAYFGDACEHGRSDGDVRLEGGADYEGRVEVWYNSQWNTVCDDYWSLDDANIVCQQLGYLGAVIAHREAYFGKGSGQILLDNLLCTGREASLLDCQHNGLYLHNCKHQGDAGVTCKTSRYCEGHVRLVNGTNAAEGRVEVWYRGRWHTVCDDYWSLQDANVACQQLGYLGAAMAHREAYFGEGSGEILLDNLRCTGREASLLDCPHNGLYVHNCKHQGDAGVTCQSSKYAERGVRLVNGSIAAAGRVEIWYADKWNTVCDHYWSIKDGDVVCRQLGYRGALKVHRKASFGEGCGQILLDNLECTGGEASLLECRHNGVYNHNCEHQDDAAVTCSK